MLQLSLMNDESLFLSKNIVYRTSCVKWNGILLVASD